MENLATLLCLVSLALGGCMSIPPVGTPENPLAPADVPPDAIRWPEKYTPDRATFFISNEITIAPPPQVVWDTLIEAETWPTRWRAAESLCHVQRRAWAWSRL